MPAGAYRAPARYLPEDRGHDTPCWIWQGALGAHGHGIICNAHYSGVAHRLFYTEAQGAIPAGAVLDHLCRQPACVNPAHLEPVTQAENVRRSPLAKLCQEQVDEIRLLFADGGRDVEIASMFGVSRACINDIRNGRRWASPGGVVHAAA